MAQQLPPFAALLPLLLPCAAAAQELAWTGGVLGSSTSFTLEADAGEIWILGLSNNAGPTPFALIDPADPRVLLLGLEFLPLWPSGVVPGGGPLVLPFNFAAQPGLQGLPLHGQFLTLFGTATLVDDLSNDVAFRLQLPATSFDTVGARNSRSTQHTQTLLPDGRVLITGGVDESGVAPILLAASELYEPQKQSFVSGPALQTARTSHTATLLQDGRVLIAGGRGAAGALASCELFDPATGTFAGAGDLPAPRSQHTATLLADGRVLVAGGLSHDVPSDVVASLLSALRPTALYDPATDVWSPGPLLAAGLVGHAVTRIADDRVLLTGGVELTSLFGFPVQTWSARTWLFDPAGTLAAAASLPGPRARHASLTPAADGRALVLGGERIEPFFQPVYTADVWRYEPDTNTWTTLPSLALPRGYHAAVEAAGRIVVAGGVSAVDRTVTQEFPEPTIEVAPGDVSAWGPPIPLVAGRQRVAATPVDGGQRVLVTGGALGMIFPDPTAETVLP